MIAVDIRQDSSSSSQIEGKHAKLRDSLEGCPVRVVEAQREPLLHECGADVITLCGLCPYSAQR